MKCKTPRLALTSSAILISLVVFSWPAYKVGQYATKFRAESVSEQTGVLLITAMLLLVSTFIIGAILLSTGVFVLDLCPQCMSKNTKKSGYNSESALSKYGLQSRCPPEELSKQGYYCKDCGFYETRRYKLNRNGQRIGYQTDKFRSCANSYNGIS